jgi:predicted secreted Zn-dependent protease
VSSKGDLMKGFLSILIPAGLLVGVSPAHAEPTVHIRVEYYDVHGHSAHELRQSMNRHGNKWTDGATYDALTTWNVMSHYDLAEENGQCRVVSVKVNAEIVHKLPRWVNRSETAPGLVEKWDRYLQALMVHEEGHRDFGIQAARETEEAISGMTTSRGCEELRSVLKARVDELIDQIKKQELEYDQRTDYGRLQGVVFPY